MASALTGMGYADAINGVPTGNNRIIMCQGIARNATEGAGGSDLWPPTTVRFVAAAIGCGHCPPNPNLSTRLNYYSHPEYYHTLPGDSRQKRLQSGRELVKIMKIFQYYYKLIERCFDLMYN